MNQASGNKESKNKNELGKLFFVKSLLESKEVVNFIVDSGATDHIVNKSFILSDFKRCENGVIKSANKNTFVDIVIDGKRNLLLQADSTGDVLKLTDVVAAKDISKNLLSLRKLADGSFSIYLDDKSLRVYNNVTNKTILEGTYKKI